jgi:hypothetical protein
VPTVTLSARLTENRLPGVIRGVHWLADAWPKHMAGWQEVHHREEAPLGQEFYTDEMGNEHPGWLRDSVDSVELPGGQGYITVVHADYGIYVNNGTRNMAANPFWERATLRTEREADDLLDNLTREALARFARVGSLT